MAPVELDDKTKNWLKAVLALKHLKKGLLPFVDTEVSKFHNNLLATHGSCNQCTIENVLTCPTKKNACWWKKGIKLCQFHDQPHKQSRSCPNGVCYHIRDAIVREHFKGEPMWSNTDATKWWSNAWEVAKCYLPPRSQDDASSADTDCSKMLSLCLHCFPIARLVGHVKDDFKKNRDNRNTLIHSGTQELNDKERSGFIKDAIQLLSNYQASVSPHTKDCIDTLNQIDSDGFILTTDDVLGVIKEKVEAIRKKQEELEAKLQETNIKTADNTTSIADLKDKLQESSKSIAGNTAAIADHKDKLDSLQESSKGIAGNTAAIADHKDKLDAYKSDIKQYIYVGRIKSNATNAVKRQLKLKDGWKATNSILQNLDVKTVDVQNDVRKLQDEMEHIRTRNENICTQINQLRDDLETLKIQIVAVDEKHDERHKEHDDRFKDCDERLDEHVQDCDERHTQMKRQIEILSQKSETRADNTMRTDEDMVAAVNSQDVQKVQARKRLRDYLIKTYKRNYSQVPVAPPKQDMWTGISEHYCEQDMKQVSMPGESQKSKGEEETDIKVNSFQDIFCRKGKQCRNIYIKGDAGSGKSVFCQHMVNRWCEIHSTVWLEDGLSERDTLSDEQKDTDMLSKFDFLFYITLRHATHLYDIESMIKQNVLRNNKALLDQLTDVLENESDKCLILLDGLDEWSPPVGSARSQFVTSGLPDRDDSYDWTILTTTRPCQLETIRPKPCEMDQLIELSGLTRQSVEGTINTVVGYLNNRYPKSKMSNKSPDDCFEHLYDKDLYDIMTFPIMLMSLVCIWFEDGHVGKTKCAIYAAMVDLYLRYTDLKTDENTLSHCDTATECHDLPACLGNRKFCQRLKQPIFKLSKLAFHSLFSKDRSSSLVFESRTTNMHGISESDVDLWLKIGLLSQDSVDMRSTENEKMLSFPHKTIQEFLAAVYMSMHTDPDTAVLPAVKNICGSVDMVLEMSEVFVFLSGMAPTIVTTISQHISQVVSADEDIQRYRSTVTGEYSKGRMRVEDIQRLMNTCIRESVAEDGQTNIQVHIQDLIMDGMKTFEMYTPSIEEWFRFNKSELIMDEDLIMDGMKTFEMYTPSIEEWFRFNKSELISLSVDAEGWKQLRTVIGGEMYSQHLSQLEKIEIQCKNDAAADDDDGGDGVGVVSIIKSSMNRLRVLSLTGLSLKPSASKQLFQCLTCVLELQFTNCKFNLHEIETLQTLRCIHMESTTCNHCTGPCQIDLSEFTQLQRLQILDVCLHAVHINVSQLEECQLGRPDRFRLEYEPKYAIISITFHGDSSHLTRLEIRCISVKHKQLEQIMLFVYQSTGLREITLNDIKCSECGTGCTCRLDMSQHTQLEKLTLQKLHVSEVQIDTTRLYDCTIDSLRPASRAPNESGSEEISLMFHGDGRELYNLALRNIVMKHEQLEQLMFVTRNTGLRGITLSEIKCSECGAGCTCRLDLSQHTQLEHLVLQKLHVSEIHINTTWLTLQELHVREVQINTTKLVLREVHVSEVQINTTRLEHCIIDSLRPASSAPNEPGSEEISLMFHGDGSLLRDLILTNIVMKHEQLEQLMLFVTRATRLRTIILNDIKCSECGTDCICRLDLSQHTQLQETGQQYT